VSEAYKLYTVYSTKEPQTVHHLATWLTLFGRLVSLTPG